MKKYNCNNTLDYAHEASRMCRAFDKCEGCEGCPLAKKSCEIFDVTAEHIKRVQEWSDAHPEITLTDTQVEIFKALNLLGFRYIAQDKDGATFTFAEYPRKTRSTWDNGGEYHYVMGFGAKASAISALVSWDDKEPLNIEEVLKNGDNI